MLGGRCLPWRCRDKKSLRVIETGPPLKTRLIEFCAGCRDKKSLRVIETSESRAGQLVEPEGFRCRDKKSLRVIET